MELINYLIDKGANNLKNALYSAAVGGHVDIVKFFIEQIANRAGYPNITLNNIKRLINLDVLLQESITSGNIDMAKYVISLGADTNPRFLNYLLEKATISGHLDMIKPPLKGTRNI